MSYFAKLPNTLYEFNGDRFYVKDILTRNKFSSEYNTLKDLSTTYYVVDGDTLQSIALNVYGSASLHWVILLFNEIHDFRYEFPLSVIELNEYCDRKYGNALYLVKHWVYNGNIVGEIKEFIDSESWIPPENPQPDNNNCIPVSFFEYESSLNEAKRNIKLLRPELLPDFIKQFSLLYNK
jgi:hypothetical protein